MNLNFLEKTIFKLNQFSTDNAIVFKGRLIISLVKINLLNSFKKNNH